MVKAYGQKKIIRKDSLNLKIQLTNFIKLKKRKYYLNLLVYDIV